MPSNRREFIGRIGASAATLGMLPLGLDMLTPSAAAAAERITQLPAPTTAEEWDLTWVNKITGKHKAVFDVAEVDSGYGVWRTTFWVEQYKEVLKVGDRDLSPVLVLRHNGIALAMQQAFWDRYKLADELKATHPITQQGTDRNPALLSSTRNEAPPPTDPLALDKYIARGGITLGCNLAFADMVEKVATADKVPEDEARKRALAMMVPGVVLQPSGVFAVLRAQEAGCAYIRAS